MCGSLVDKVARSKQLKAVTHPEILLLFESWLDELEEEVISYCKQHEEASALDLVDDLGLSRSGALFLLTKLRGENKIK